MSGSYSIGLLQGHEDLAFPPDIDGGMLVVCGEFLTVVFLLSLHNVVLVNICFNVILCFYLFASQSLTLRGLK